MQHDCNTASGVEVADVAAPESDRWHASPATPPVGDDRRVYSRRQALARARAVRANRHRGRRTTSNDREVRRMRVIATMALAALVAACSTSPTRPPPAAVVSPTGSPSSDAAPSGSASVAASPAGSGGAPPTTNTVDQSLIQQGYKPALQNGEVVYCKSMLDSSRFPQTRCYTADQIKAMERDMEAVRNHLLKPGPCQGWGCH